MKVEGPVGLVVTDLDGTLLDEETYEVEPARAALEVLRERGIPLVLCSSKTRAEMEPIAAALGLDTPLIVENGGAIVIPAGSGRSLAAGRGLRVDADAGAAVLPLGLPRSELLAALPAIAGEAGVQVRSFADMSVDEISALTGLPEKDAALAGHREWDEPFVVTADPATPELERRLREAAERRGLRITGGGRFHHLTGPADKGGAVRALRRLLPGRGLVVGLGDAANDLPMLRAVDRPIVMPRKAGGLDPRLAAALPGAERAPAPGPAGWAAAVLAVLAGQPVTS